MSSLTPPSCTGIQNRVMGDAEGNSSLPNLNFSSLHTDSQNNSKIMQLELKKARLEMQISLSKTQTMLAEMELHLVEIELRQELWRNKSQAQVRPPAKCQTGRPYRRLLVRKPIRPTVRPRYKRPKSCIQDKHVETAHDVNVEENEQVAAASHPVDHQSHHQQIGECRLKEQGEVLFDDQRSQKVNACEIDAQKGERQHISSPDADQCHLEVAGGESRSSTVPQNVENRVDIQDAELVVASKDDNDAKRASQSEKMTEDTNNKANIETKIVQTDNITGKEEDINHCESNKGQKSNDSKEKTIKKYKRRTQEGKTVPSETCYNKDQEAEKNSTLDEHISKKHTTVKNNTKKAVSSTMVKIPIRLTLLNDSIALEINNNDVNRQNSERDDAVDTTISQITDRESAPSVNLTSSGSSAANSKNSSEGKVVGNITQNVLSTCKNVLHEEQNTNKKYSIEKKRSDTRNVEDKENTSNVSKERHRSRDSKTKSSKQDKKHGSIRNTTSTSNNVNSDGDQEAEKNNNNDKHERKSDTSNDKSSKSKKSHRHQKDENVTNKSNAKNNGKQLQMELDLSKVEECKKIKSKSSSVEKSTEMQRSSRTEGANNINTVGDKGTESYDNYILVRETDAFDKHESKSDKSNVRIRKSTKRDRHQKDENVSNKSNAKNNGKRCQMELDLSKDKGCKNIKSKSSGAEKTTEMQRPSGTEGANNINAFRNKGTESNDNYFLGRETDAFDRCKSNILDKKTQELHDMRNNLLFVELRNSSIKKERSHSLSSLETLKLYE